MRSGTVSSIKARSKHWDFVSYQFDVMGVELGVVTEHNSFGAGVLRHALIIAGDSWAQLIRILLDPKYVHCSGGCSVRI